MVEPCCVRSVRESEPPESIWSVPLLWTVSTEPAPSETSTVTFSGMQTLSAGPGSLLPVLGVGVQFAGSCQEPAGPAVQLIVHSGGSAMDGDATTSISRAARKTTAAPRTVVLVAAASSARAREGLMSWLLPAASDPPSEMLTTAVPPHIADRRRCENAPNTRVKRARAARVS